MMITNVEPYEALKDAIPVEAAKMIAEVVPPAKELATKSDIAELRGDMHQGFERQIRWMFGAMIPLWLGLYGTLITLLIRS